MSARSREGFTLLELVVAVFVLSTSGAVVALAMARPIGADDEAVQRLERARTSAILEVQVTIVAPNSTDPDARVLFLSDGRTVGPRRLLLHAHGLQQ